MKNTNIGVSHTLNKWQSFDIKISKNLLTQTRLKYSYDCFWNEIIKGNLDEGYSALAQFKVLLTDKIIRSISYVQSFSGKDEDRKKLLNNFII